MITKTAMVCIYSDPELIKEAAGIGSLFTRVGAGLNSVKNYFAPAFKPLAQGINNLGTRFGGNAFTTAKNWAMKPINGINNWMKNSANVVNRAQRINAAGGFNNMANAANTANTANTAVNTAANVANNAGNVANTAGNVAGAAANAAGAANNTVGGFVRQNWMPLSLGAAAMGGTIYAGNRLFNNPYPMMGGMGYRPMPWY